MKTTIHLVRMYDPQRCPKQRKWVAFTEAGELLCGGCVLPDEIDIRCRHCLESGA